MLFKTRKIDEVYLQAQYLENMGKNKRQPSGSRQKDNQDASKRERNGKERQEDNSDCTSLQGSKKPL
jgi:hypothetical protein